MSKDANYCCFLPQIRDAMIETNPEIWDFNLQSIDDYYLRFRQMSFLALAENRHGALFSPKQNIKIQKLKIFYEIFKYWKIPYRVFETIEGILQKDTQ